MSRDLVLVLGGARAGKSAFAERLARCGGKVLFVATAEAGDEEMARRIARHKRRRPKGWETLEEPIALPEALAGRKGRYDTVIIDCLTLWVSNLMLQRPRPKDLDAAVQDAARRLIEVSEQDSATWIVVSNEVGLGVVPPTEAGRTYRDLLGRVNQRFAQGAGKVYLLVAGLFVELKALGARPVLNSLSPGGKELE